MTVTNEERRRRALAGVEWLRANPGQWDQRYYTSVESGVRTFCWGGAVLHTQGYTNRGNTWVGVNGAGCLTDTLLEEVLGVSTEIGIISRLLGYMPMVYTEAALDELERRVLTWLRQVEEKS